MSALISVKNLTRTYGDVCAVDDISFELNVGDILGFLGPNGAGKSTTMRMLSGNLAPSAGEITINGIDLLDDPARAKLELGYLPETPPLYKDMRVDEYLRFAAGLHRVPSSEIEDRLAQTQHRCGLDEVGRRLIGNLSKGYQQRVGIAQAIIHTPDVIILDEPTVGLDPNQIMEIRHLISELGQHHGIILCSHILPEIQAVCNRVQIINHGRLVYQANIEELNAKTSTGEHFVAFTSLQDEATLSTLDHIESCTKRSDGFIIRSSNIERLVADSVESGWGLIKLVPLEKSLEQVFTDLTTGESIEDAA